MTPETIDTIVKTGSVAGIAALAYGVAFVAKKNGWIKDTRIPMFLALVGLICGLIGAIFLPGSRVDFSLPWQDAGWALIATFAGSAIQGILAAMAAVGINQISVQAWKEKQQPPDATPGTTSPAHPEDTTPSAGA